MPAMQIQIAGTTHAVNSGAKQPVSPVRISRTESFGQSIELILNEPNLIGRTGLRSRVRLWIDGQLCFTGQIFSQETFANPTGSGKRIVAAGPFDWCSLVQALDDAGVPKLQWTQTTVGTVLQYLLNRGAGELRALEAAGENFYDPSALAALDAPVDHLWAENRNLKTLIAELLAVGDYRLAIHPETLFWTIATIGELDFYSLDLGRGSNWGLDEFCIASSLADCCAAVRLVSDRAVGIGFAPAVPAWDENLESQWQLRGPCYADPDADDPSALAWVYRRFRYDQIPGLLENEPVELVQKTATDNGGWTYQPVESLPLDRVNRCIIARLPILAGPSAKRINGKNPLSAGAAESPEVFIRYRYFLSQPQLEARYPSTGFGGRTLETAGLARELVVYMADSRQINDDRARRLWRAQSDPGRQVELTIRGPIIPELMIRPMRLKLIGADSIDLPRGRPLVADAAEYDFTTGTMKLRMSL